MPSPRPSFLDDRYPIGILLLALVLFSWFSGLKNTLLEWSSSAEKSPSSAMPNILMIVVDDLGYDDSTAINSGGLPTPNIRQLADRGTTFKRHYADSTCTPSRVAIMTGRYPERSGFRPVGSEIPVEYQTIAEQLQEAGYATYLTGKWHAGEDRDEAFPHNKGFDQWFGFLNQWELSGEITESIKGARKPTYRNPMLRVNGGELQQHDGHLTDILTEHTIAKLAQLNAAEQPWFLYHAFLAPHQPIQPDQRYAAKFPATPEGKYRALVTQLDDAIGRILSAVDRNETLVVFVSDNGGTNRERNNNYPFYGKKNEMFEGAFRTPLIISWPGYIPEGKAVDDVVMNVDIYPTLLAAIHKEPPQDIDGKNLWPTFLHANAIEKRSRSWEVYSANVNTLSFSFLSESANWRLASLKGLAPSLFNLGEEASGEKDVASIHQARVAELSSGFWREHWNKSLIPVRSGPGNEEGQTHYSGFDAMRTPYRYGFAIGIEMGPLPEAMDEIRDYPFYVLGGQEGVWELRFRPGHGLEWQMGDSVLRDASFEPSECNAIVLTGYFEPKGHLAKREPKSQVKLYSSALLRDSDSEIASGAVEELALNNPTFVNYQGKATFSNMALSSFSDTYSPRLLPQYMDIYTTLYREKKLSIADVKMMDAELCK